MPRPPAKALPVTGAERDELLAISRHRATPQSVVLRLKIVLGAAEGLPNKTLARQLSTTLPTVLLWRRRYEDAGLSGILQDQPRSGRPKRVWEEKEGAIVKATMESKPANATPWSVRMMAKSTTGKSLDRAPHLAKTQAATTPGGVVQVQHRS